MALPFETRKLFSDKAVFNWIYLPCVQRIIEAEDD